jgi:hypothetical protein
MRDCVSEGSADLADGIETAIVAAEVATWPNQPRRERVNLAGFGI